MTPELYGGESEPIRVARTPEARSPAAKPNITRYSLMESFGRLIRLSAERKRKEAVELYHSKLDRMKKLQKRRDYLAMLRRKKKANKEQIQSAIDLSDEQAQTYVAERR